MSTQLEFGNTQSRPDPSRSVMNGKPVFTRAAKTVINFESNFSHKLLCDGLTFSAGDACCYSCSFCYVPDLMRKLRAIPAMAHIEGEHFDIVVRRENPAGIARQQLTDRYGRPKFKSVRARSVERESDQAPEDRRVIYSSPLVDIAGNMELVRETVEICKVILELTNWDIRLLSKSNLLPKVAQGLDGSDGKNGRYRDRVIYGVSTGTLDDGLARAFEAGTPLVSKRIQSLHWLQDNGFRTFGMVCPSLPQRDYREFARATAAAIRADRCEHVWAEVINLRGESFTRTMDALRAGGFSLESELVEAVSSNKDAWELYARHTFNAYGDLPSSILPKGKLRFLQYVTPASRAWWTSQAGRGAVVL